MASRDVTEQAYVNGTGQTQHSPVLNGQTTSLVRNSPQKSTSVKRRQFSRQRSSTFSLHHVDSAIPEPSPQLDDIDLSRVPWWTSERFRLAVLCFFGFVCLYAQRVNLSIAIVSMTSHPRQNSSTSGMPYVSTAANGTDDGNDASLQMDENCPELSKTEKVTEFTWSKELTGLILGAFFWGYLVFQVPGGRMSEMFGAKRVITAAMFPLTVLSFLSPVVARLSPYLFIVLRVLVGLCEGVLYPATQALWSKWSPPNERSRLVGFSFAGGQFGNAISFPIGGYLCAYGFDGGWPSVFYVIGAVSFLWCILWVVLATDSPEDNKRITDIEKKYIAASLGSRNRQKASIPWKAMFTSGPVWGIMIAHMCSNYGAYMMLTKIPSYMKEVLKFDIKANGLYSMLPYLTFWLFITIGGTLTDLLISRNIMTIGIARKFMTFLGTVGPAVFMVGTSYMRCDQAVGAVVMLTLSVGMCGFHFSGYIINHGDIAPPFAGTLFGITNAAATFPGIIAPYVVSAMTPNGTREEWQAAFYVAAGTYCLGCIAYMILGSGEIQPWARVDVKSQDAESAVRLDLHEVDEKEEKEPVEDRNMREKLKTTSA